MIRSPKFWISMVVFQVVFGLAVFAITRQHYIDDSDNVSADPVIVRQPSFSWPGGITGFDSAQLRPLPFDHPTIEGPVEISRQANEFFANQQYSRAAQLYEQLLVFYPDNVNTYNNLGLTLHYLGRTTEAVRKLNEGVAVDPADQRIWLTLGFVNSQLGDTDQARAALTTAVEMGANNKLGQSAATMLENLP
ncbi:hypothetical protein A9Q98_07630 [Thalassotalea sp. 42_200_T64]|nr:hypothetical protein A9Q98_07630 [Thalassotalea sp. 42_200_T64]